MTKEGFALRRLAARLALELGPENQELLFRHYRVLVAPEQAAKWWGYPAGDTSEFGGSFCLTFAFLLCSHLSETGVIEVNTSLLLWFGYFRTTLVGLIAAF